MEATVAGSAARVQGTSLGAECVSAYPMSVQMQTSEVAAGWIAP